MTNAENLKSSYRILNGDSLKLAGNLEDQSIQTIVTSPPYFGLRDYGHDGQIGLEEEPQVYVKKLIDLFERLRPKLKSDGTAWVNLGDSYAGSGKGPAGNLGKTHNERHLEHKHGGIVPEGLKPKDLIGIPWRFAFAMQEAGWYLRQDIIWSKPNPMPESVKDRCTKAHEYIFLFSKSKKYFFDYEAIREDSIHYATENPKRNKRSVWTVTVKGYREAHFATYPVELIEPCVLAGSRPNDLVLDPFNGAGTTGVAAIQNGRRYIGLELNPDYVQLSEKRLASINPLFQII